MCMCDSMSDSVHDRLTWLDDTVVDRVTYILWMVTVCVVRYSTE